MVTTDTNISSLVVNKLTEAQLATLVNDSTVPANQVFVTPDTETVDSVPTQNSNNLVKSGGVYSALSAKENLSNKVTSIDSSSTDSQYPSAKCVYDIIGNIETLLGGI